MSLNCVRIFFSSLSHGIFMNNHNLQILSLIFFDVLQLTSIVYHRKCFRYKFVLYMTFLHSLSWIAFNLTIITSKYLIFSGCLLGNYTDIFTLIIFLILLTNAFKTIFLIFTSLYVSIRKICYINKKKVQVR